MSEDINCESKFNLMTYTIQTNIPFKSKSAFKSCLYGVLLYGGVPLLLFLVVLSLENVVPPAIIIVFALAAFFGVLRSLSVIFKTITKPINYIELEGDCDNGKGKCYFDCSTLDDNTKEIYFGYFKNKCRNGKGKYEFSNGDYYDGEWENDNMHGIGIYYWKSGHIYSGSFMNNERHGKGQLTFANSDVDSGIWTSGRLTQPDNSEPDAISETHSHDKLKESWTCTKCNEVVPEGFDTCWKCGGVNLDTV